MSNACRSSAHHSSAGCGFDQRNTEGPWSEIRAKRGAALGVYHTFAWKSPAEARRENFHALFVRGVTDGKMQQFPMRIYPFDNALNCLLPAPNPFDRVGDAVSESNDGLHVEHGSQKRRSRSNASTLVQVLQSLEHAKEACVWRHGRNAVHDFVDVSTLPCQSGGMHHEESKCEGCGGAVDHRNAGLRRKRLGSDNSGGVGGAESW